MNYINTNRELQDWLDNLSKSELSQELLGASRELYEARQEFEEVEVRFALLKEETIKRRCAEAGYKVRIYGDMLFWTYGGHDSNPNLLPDSLEGYFEYISVNTIERYVMEDEDDEESLDGDPTIETIDTPRNLHYDKLALQSVGFANNDIFYNFIILNKYQDQLLINYNRDTNLYNGHILEIRTKEELAKEQISGGMKGVSMEDVTKNLISRFN